MPMRFLFFLCQSHVFILLRSSPVVGCMQSTDTLQHRIGVFFEIEHQILSAMGNKSYRRPESVYRSPIGGGGDQGFRDAAGQQARLACALRRNYSKDLYHAITVPSTPTAAPRRRSIPEPKSSFQTSDFLAPLVLDQFLDLSLVQMAFCSPPG